MEWGVFLFFAAWVVLATIFIFFMLPETKGVPVERVQALFAEHKLWRKMMGASAADHIIELKLSASGDVERAASGQHVQAEDVKLPEDPKSE